MVPPCQYLRRANYCSWDVNCNFGHGNYITYGVAEALVVLTLKYFKLQTDIGKNPIRHAAAKFRMAQKDADKNENNIVINTENKVGCLRY